MSKFVTGFMAGVIATLGYGLFEYAKSEAANTAEIISFPNGRWNPSA